MSYIRFADQHEEGRLSELRNRLSGEVKIQTGEDFPIFQDRNDILWGQNWKARIEESIDSATFLVCILTPGFLKSDYCRKEVMRFLDREKRLGRKDLILSIHYVDCPELAGGHRGKRDGLAKLIASRQLADWRELRFEPLTSGQAGKAIAQLATQIRDAMLRSRGKRARPGRGQAVATPSVPKRPSREASIAEKVRGLVSAEEAKEIAKSPAPKSEPPTRVVDAAGQGTHTSIAEAVAQAAPGDRILIRRGVYAESVTVDKPLELVGDGLVEEIIVSLSKDSVVSFQTTIGRISNLTLRQEAYDAATPVVAITQGRLILENCVISANGGSAISVVNGAAPQVSNNKILQNASQPESSSTILIANARILLENNEITGGKTDFAIVALAGSEPTVRHNRITGGIAGICVFGGGARAVVDGNLISEAEVGVDVSDGAEATLTRNRIRQCRSGVNVYDRGRLTAEDNHIIENSWDGIEIGERGEAAITRNVIAQNGNFGISALKGANVSSDANTFQANSKGDISTEPDATAAQQR
ncbi:MAG TPA: right-handed parallel beta-helix repeat-containing protein [Terriglobales bacterium]|nr:right-handed parallel beta-helix repeat-containing protein [Terriglobales bacterium]